MAPTTGRGLVRSCPMKPLKHTTHRISAVIPGIQELTLQRRGCDVHSYTHAGTAGYCRLYQRTRITHKGPATRTDTAGQSLSTANRATGHYERSGPYRARTAANWETACNRRRTRPLARTS